MSQEREGVVSGKSKTSVIRLRQNAKTNRRGGAEKDRRKESD